MKWMRTTGVLLAGLTGLALGCRSPDLSGDRNAPLINDGPQCVGARSPGFWCQNQDGHPELSVEEFWMLAGDAATLLAAVPELDTAEEIAAAVCDTSNQLARHLSSVALDLSANLIDEDTPLVGEDFATVGDAVDAAIAILTGNSDADANDVKDVLDGINNNKNVELGDDCGEETQPECGNGVVEGDEQCDDGNDDDGDACANDCTTNGGGGPECGNGVVEGDEQCDDGNDDDGDACANDCTTNGGGGPVCGNGVVEGDEECDDGNDNDSDSCANDCTENGGPPPVCGNGKVEGDEECDDGNRDDNDSCSNVCTEQGG